MKLKIGDKAPVINAKDQNGEDINLENYLGKKIILYFYPKDSTSGCTAEACNLQENYTVLIDKKYIVLGVSPDNGASHLKFIAKNKLQFNLIADTEKQVAMDYGVWAEKSMYGKKYMGILRTTFIIDEKGIIENIIEKVKTKDHANQILDLQ